MRDSRQPGLLRAKLRLLEVSPPTEVRPSAAVRVAARNTGDTVWLAGPLTRGGFVQLGIQLVDQAGAVVHRDWARAPLPDCVLPGQEVIVRAELALGPTVAANPVLRLDLVDEGICWFADRGSETLDVRLSG
jgi:hypothetical protein